MYENNKIKIIKQFFHLKMSSNFTIYNKKFSFYLIIVIVSLSMLNVFAHEYNEEEINESVNKKYITCGSSLRITNIMTKFK